MLSIAKIGSAASQAGKAGSYAAYLGAGAAPTAREAYAEYAIGPAGSGAAPFWACKGPQLLGLGDDAEARHVELLARGFHPITGAPLTRGAGDGHVMGLDMTFSAPKDFSAVFAGADGATRAALLECLREAAKAALSHAETAVATRHGHGGMAKRVAEAAAAFCVTHFASRALDPQLHVHALLLNLGKRAGSPEWSAVEQRPIFERKMALGALFRVELASRLRGLGFDVRPAGPYFEIAGVTPEQREALSTRSREIDAKLREGGLSAGGAKARQAAALSTRGAKAEPPLPELLSRFQAQAEALGITPEAVSRMRAAGPLKEPFAIDREALLDDLMASQSCATAQEALAAICERAMGRWSARECLAELSELLACESVVHMGQTEQLTQVFTTRATVELEARASALVAEGRANGSWRVARSAVDAEFDRLEADLRARLGVDVSLAQQRTAARHVACESGAHAFVVGWAGAGKTTLLSATARAFRGAGFEVFGCCQSASAARNLQREADIPSRTIASLMLALRDGRARLGPRSALVLDEAGMVGSREFAALQEAARAAGAKLICVGDHRQLQPIEAGGIFGSLARIHGAAEISTIQRQRTDFEPLFKWLESKGRAGGALDPLKAAALRELPEDARMAALEAICATQPKLSRAFAKWRARYDFEWMRGAVEKLATGRAAEALADIDRRGRLATHASHSEAVDALVSGWAADKTPLALKAIVAATRAEVAELNERARAVLVARGEIDDAAAADVEIEHRDGTKAPRRFGPGDRIVFTQNDRGVGVSNGTAGTVTGVERRMFETLLAVDLDEPNERGEERILVPCSFGRFDWGLASTVHRSQGRTFDSAHALANPAHANREWTYVAASRSRFATTLHVDCSELGLVDLDSHRAGSLAPKDRARAVAALASRMSRSRAKGTTLDYPEPTGAEPPADIGEPELPAEPRRATLARAVAAAATAAARLRSLLARAGDARPAAPRPQPEADLELGPSP